MADKIIIGDSNSKRNDRKVRESELHEHDNLKITAAEPLKETGQAEPSGQETGIPLDENVWGNDHAIIHQLDEKQLADRRLFVRIRHMQRLECHKVYDGIEEEPILLKRPLELVTSDISLGGIGVISERKIMPGKILEFQFKLDHIPYVIKCEVIFCVPMDDKFRAGLKLVQREKQFVRHLKIYVARISLNSVYGDSAEG